MKKTCLTFGYFDGMHIGHQAVIAELDRRENAGRILLSFEDRENPVLCTEKEKQHFLESCSSVELVSLDKSVYETRTVEEFCKEILSERFHADEVVIGESFEKKEAVLKALKETNIPISVVPAVKNGGRTVSSEWIKETAGRNDFQKMRELLGGSYVVSGTVVHGKGIGRSFGLPTANIRMQENKIFPPCGVYGARFFLEGKTYRAVTNVGTRPSADDNPVPTVESFILDFDENIYGKEVFVELLCFVREIRRFPGGLTEVRQQVDKDIETVKQMLKAEK